MKFKNIKKKIYKKKSPSNSRSISESQNVFLSKISQANLIKWYRIALKVFVAITFILAASVVGFDLQRNWQLQKEINLQRESVIRDLNFWKSFMSQHQNFPNAYFQAALLEYKLGDRSKTKAYVEKGLSLDPGSADGKKLEQLLIGK